MALNSNRPRINPILTVFAFSLLVTSHAALAQESFSVKMPQQTDRVTVEHGSFGRILTSDLFVNTEKDSNKRNPSFDRDIKELGIKGKIANCSLLIDIPAGSENHSYGGFCSLEQEGKKRDIYICNDNMVGHFALYHSSVTIKHKPHLIKFVVSNCIGG
jgi:hypothetical protein